MDPAFRRPPSLEEQTGDLPMFDAPRIETPAPSAPGSASSEDAADAISDPLRARNHRRIMMALYYAGTRPRSMAEIVERTKIPLNVVCARLSELRPLWVEQHDRACISAVKPSLRVDGFTLTQHGVKRVYDALEGSRK